MAKVFWVVCPKCENKFYAANDDFRNEKRKLWCPECDHRFYDYEAKELIDQK